MPIFIGWRSASQLGVTPYQEPLQCMCQQIHQRDLQQVMLSFKEQITVHQSRACECSAPHSRYANACMPTCEPPFWSQCTQNAFDRASLRGDRTFRINAQSRGFQATMPYMQEPEPNLHSQQARMNIVIRSVLRWRLLHLFLALQNQHVHTSCVTADHDIYSFLTPVQ